MDKEIFDMINRIQSDDKIYNDYLKFIDTVISMIKFGFMLKFPNNENEILDGIIKAIKFSIQKNKDNAFVKNMMEQDLGIIGGLILHSIIPDMNIGENYDN